MLSIQQMDKNLYGILLCFNCKNVQIRREFQAILQLEYNVNSLMYTWVEWSTKIAEFSKAESSSRPYIKKKLKKLDETQNFPYPDGMQLPLSLCLCMKLLSKTRRTSECCILRTPHTFAVSMGIRKRCYFYQAV